MTGLCHIRSAMRHDIPAMCWMLDQLRQDTVWRSIPVESDYTYAAEQFEWRLLDDDQCVLVAEMAGDLIGLAANLALPSVILMMMFGQTRIFFVMARDGLLPEKLASVHPLSKSL